MILPYHEGHLFFTLLDMVTVYAHQRLAVVSDADFFDDTAPRGIGEAGQRETLAELWNHVDLLDDFVRENPADLTRGELDIITSWKDAYTYIFYVDRSPDGQLRFLGDKHLYDVCGLSLEIEDMLNTVPAMVQTTLLPFRNHVVYAMTIAEYPIQMGEGMLDIMRDGTREAFNAGRIVTNSQQFAIVVPQAKEAQIEREAQAIIDDFERAQEAELLAEDQHEGMLAGLSLEEREAAIDEYYRSGGFEDELEGMLDDVLTPSERLKGLCLDGPVVTSLDELLEHDDLPTTDDLAVAIDELTLEDLGLDATDNPDMVERFEHIKTVFAEETDLLQPGEAIASVVTDPEALYRRFTNLPAYEVAALRNLAEAGGRLSVAVDDDDALYNSPRPVPGLCYLFEVNGTFEFVMPDEVVPIVNGLDWDALNALGQKRIELIRFVDAVLELRGIVPYVEVIEEYAKLHPNGYPTAQEIHDELERQLLSPYCDQLLLDTGDEVYLLHEDLAWLYLDGQDLDPYEDGGIIEGNLDDMLETLLDRQKGKEPRPVSPDMCGKSSIYRWRDALPAMCALREYLDSHVPDTQSDYEFADEVLSEVNQMLRWEFHNDMINQFFEVLEDHDFIPTEAQAYKLVELLMNAHNTYPAWTNNGWAPNELHEQATGRKVFYNEDGSVKKVGRNDPCPCGSGKKYKKCCGAH